MYVFILPNAWLATLSPMVIWSNKNANIMNLQNVAVWSGTSFSQKLSMAGISIIIGMDIIAMNAVEYLLSRPANLSMSSLWLPPSAFSICGFIALRMDVAMKDIAPYT